ncbi:MAG: cobaltochelatase subunit CobN [Candidatus Methanomethylophilaceae archaeon]|nr:cobaltochelatase subunit CobN [Candidatus Methanomethylophilaceae archaeon]
MDRGVCEDIERADVAITDLMGIGREAYAEISKSMKSCKGIRICIGGMALHLNLLGGFDERRMKYSRDDEENIERISVSWKRAEFADIEFIYSLLLGKYLGVDGIEEVPHPPCLTGVYIKDPVTLNEFHEVSEYDVGILSEGYDVALLFNGSNYPHRTHLVNQRVFERLSSMCRVLPIAMNSYSIANVDRLKQLIGSPKVIVDLLPFRFMSGPMGGDSVSANWLLREIGAPVVSPFCFSKTTEEEWRRDPGGIDPMEFMLEIFLPELDGAICTVPVGFRKATEALDNGLELSETVPLDERVDRICGKVMGLLNLRSKGNCDKRVALIAYNYPPGEDNLFGGSFLDGSGSISNILGMLVDNGYRTERLEPQEIVERFINGGLINEGDWHDGSQAIHYKDYDEHDKRISSYWGRPPGTVMTDGDGYIIPGIRLGNVFLGIQPPRKSGSADPKSYHDQHVPPHHQYAAFYKWLKDEFKADAVVHLGTHGTLEFLPGKQSAMSGECFPDSILRNIPHIYIYYSGNPSEAMIAKRRTHAQLVSYMQPPMVRSGLYGELSELERLISEYRESRITDPGRSQMVNEEIRAKSEKLRLPSDIDALEDELTSIRESLIPDGLHVFGRMPSEEQALAYVSEVREMSGCTIGDEDLILRYRNSGEQKGLVSALDGRYLEPGVGGDALTDPDVLPSGRNIVQFNPERIPSQSAFMRGVQAAKDAVAGFMEKMGRAPDSAGIVLWGLETSRTQGMSIGQICGYLGVRMTSDSGDFANRFEVVPLEELGRPRVDVCVTICGFFRDMFPQLIPGLSDIFRMVSDLDESGNCVRIHTQENLAALGSKGYSEVDSRILSSCRLFGPATGEYGTGMTSLVNSSQWEDEDDLGESFISSMRYAYTRDRNAFDAPGLLNMNLGRVEVVSQIRDSTDREIIDLDHYYEFLGGLSKSVEISSGRRSMAFVVDGSRPTIRVTDLKSSIERGIRTRLLNPKWIDGLLTVYSQGAPNINDRFENVLGLAATTGEVDSGVFSDMAACYVSDEAMRKRMMDNNGWAYLKMLERLSEADRRGYWDATDEEREALREAFLETEDRLEASADTESG